MENKKTYGFIIGNKKVTEKAKDEQKALIKVINNWWNLIDENEKIELLGEEI